MTRYKPRLQVLILKLNKNACFDKQNMFINIILLFALL